MQLGHIEVFVRDVRRARDFYAQVLDFEVVDEQGGQFVWLKSGQLEILLRPGRAAAARTNDDATAGDASRGAATHGDAGQRAATHGDASRAAATYGDARQALVLYTDDLPATRRRLEEHGVEIRGTDGSAGCLTFTDPDGHWFQLVDPESH